MIIILPKLDQIQKIRTKNSRCQTCLGVNNLGKQVENSCVKLLCIQTKTTFIKTRKTASASKTLQNPLSQFRKLSAKMTPKNGILECFRAGTLNPKHERNVTIDRQYLSNFYCDFVQHHMTEKSCLSTSGMSQKQTLTHETTNGCWMAQIRPRIDPDFVVVFLFDVCAGFQRAP